MKWIKLSYPQMNDPIRLYTVILINNINRLKALHDCIQTQGVYTYIHQKNQTVMFNNVLLISFVCVCTCIH